jgi:hypothetical protein
VLLTCFCIAFLQRAISLLHHDLHTQNVLVKRIEPTDFYLEMQGEWFVVSRVSLVPLVCDFGFASFSIGAMEVERIDWQAYEERQFLSEDQRFRGPLRPGL